MTRNNRIAMIAMLLGWGAALAIPENYTFQVTDGKWSEPGNWQPQTGPPGELDSATILANQTCRIQDRDESINKLTVQGTLRLMGRTLTMAGPLLAGAAISLNGLIQAEGQAMLVLVHDVSVEGNGTISASGQGNHLRVDYVRQIAMPRLALAGATGARPTLKGNLWFLVHLRNNGGHVLVDAPNDRMEIGGGTGDVELWVSGTDEGDFTVTAGEMVFRHATPEPLLRAEWRIEGGTLAVTDEATCGWWREATHNQVLVKLSGGTLKIGTGAYWARRGLEYTGGQIYLEPTAALLAFTKGP